MIYIQPLQLPTCNPLNETVSGWKRAYFLRMDKRAQPPRRSTLAPVRPIAMETSVPCSIGAAAHRLQRQSWKWFALRDSATRSCLAEQGQYDIHTWGRGRLGDRSGLGRGLGSSLGGLGGARGRVVVVTEEVGVAIAVGAVFNREARARAH
jgi:hypothetical protein